MVLYVSELLYLTALWIYFNELASDLQRKKRRSGGFSCSLRERKAVSAATEAEARRAEKLRLTGCPPGHTLLPYDERVATLADLKQS